MSSYLSNILTNTTNRYASLRRTLLNNEDDGDSPDDSHISRVLRAYYTEKARPYPPWLPPDPNDRRSQFAQQQGGSYYGNNNTSAGTGRGGQFSSQQQQGNRGSLNDLWDPPASSQAPTSTAPQSLRAGRRVGGPAGARPESGPASLAPPARPLPSQREGSYQSMHSATGSVGGGRLGVDPSPPASSGGGGTAQERLKARLWGGNRAASPAGGVSMAGAGSGGGGAGGGGGGNPYDQPYDGGGSARRFGR